MIQKTEQRETKRHQIEAPIKLARGTGNTRDFSMSGVYFTTKVNFEPGDELKFVFNLRYALPHRSVPLDCHGQVLRVEKNGNVYGVAARIDHITYLH